MSATSGASASSEPFDLEAAAKAAMADSVPFRFTWAGEEYELPPQSEWSLDVLRHLANGDLETVFDELLGEAGFDKLTAAGMTVGAMNILFDEAAKVAGMESLPNSPAQRRRGSTRK